MSGPVIGVVLASLSECCKRRLKVLMHRKCRHYPSPGLVSPRTPAISAPNLLRTLRAEGDFRRVFQDNFNTSTEINYREYKILATGMEER